MKTDWWFVRRILLLLFRDHKWASSLTDALAIRCFLLFVVGSHVHLIFNWLVGCLISVTIMCCSLSSHAILVTLGRSKSILTAWLNHSLDVVIDSCSIGHRSTGNMLLLLRLLDKYVVIAVSYGCWMISSSWDRFIVISLNLRHVVSLKHYFTNLVLSLFDPGSNQFFLQWLRKRTARGLHHSSRRNGFLRIECHGLNCKWDDASSDLDSLCLVNI